MCNAWCFDFAELVRPHLRGETSILEVGSRDVNGTLRSTFSDAAKEYVGVDLFDGPGVDIVMDVKDLSAQFQSKQFEVVISTEMIEHCYDWQDALYQMLKVLSDGGFLLVTTRSPGFELHDYPADHWRFSKKDFEEIFSPIGSIIAIEDDMTLGWPCGIGVIVKKEISAQGLEEWYQGIKSFHVYSMAQETGVQCPTENYIFDQYSRYLPVAKVVDAIIGKENSGALDIGSGDECILGAMLPGQNFTFIDPLLDQKEGGDGRHSYLAGSIYDKRLNGRKFSAVTSVDVLEHIPPLEREQFLERVSELAELAVVMAFPCLELSSDELDRSLNQKYQNIFGKDYPWLEEHFEFGMPSIKMVEEYFSKRGWHTKVIGQGHVPWLEEFLGFALAGLEEETLRQAVFDFSREFNTTAAEYDICPPYYRYVFVASKNDINGSLDVLFPVTEAEEELSSITAALRERFYESLLKAGKNQSEEMQRLRLGLQDFQRLSASLSAIKEGGAAQTLGAMRQVEEGLRKQLHMAVAAGEKMARQLKQTKGFEEELTERLRKASLTEESLVNQLKLSQESEASLSEQLRHSQKSEASLRLELQHAELKNQQLLSPDVIADNNAAREKLEAKYAEVVTSYKRLHHQFEQERFSIVKPLLRRGYRLGASSLSVLPPKGQTLLRRIKQRYVPQKVAVEMPSLNVPLSIETSPPLLPSTPLWPDLSPPQCDSTGYDVVVFPVIDWHFRVQRPQHIAKGFAANGHRVFYLSVSFGPEVPSAKLLERVDERVFIYQLSIPLPHPTIYEEMPDRQQEAFLIEAVDQLCRQVLLQQVVAIIDHPFWTRIAQSIPGVTTVYDCMDHHGGFSNNGKAIFDAEKTLLKQADAVITTSAKLSEMIGSSRENSIIRNAADSQWFSIPPEQLLYEKKRPIVGYYGAISEWFDIDLVVAAAKYYPEFDFVLVGSTHMCNIKKAKKIGNIHFIGEVPYSDLKGYLYAFDVCLIPFKLTELIQCTNPVKLYEYLAAGKPVVATEMPELRLVPEQVYLSDDTSDFIDNIKTAMEQKDDAALIEARRRFAFENDWDHRTVELESLISGLYSRVSVVVLTYNNLEFTQACLHSLELHSHYPNWELIIIDNASCDGTQDFLLQYEADHEHVKVILNEENLGFAAGNNVGIRAASGDYLVLLNNDTYVTKGWINGLLHHFDDEIGIVGPVTNNIGNEARIEIHYANMDEMAVVARKYTKGHVREHIVVDTAAFFCVAIRRELIEKVGLLDEAFGRGFFEDDDYCMRARNAGYKVVIADDVFVHHHLSASFNKLKDAEREKLFESNKVIYERKWGKWNPHRYRG